MKTLLGQPTLKSAPRAKITRLPDIPSIPRPARAEKAFPAKKTLLFFAGILLLILAASQLSEFFQSRPKAVVSEIPIEYLEPTACRSDDDCVIQTDCCSATAVNLYHDEKPKEKNCPARLCPSINVGVACIDRQCAVVTAQEQIRGRILYSPRAPNDVSGRIEAYDCARRSGDYQPCQVPCPDGTTNCEETCSATCLLPNDFLPTPSVRTE